MKNKKKTIAVIVTLLLIGVTLGILLSATPMVASGTGSLDAFWRMDTGLGSMVVDSSDSANDGMMSGGKFGNGLEFDGVDDYISAPYNFNDESTIEMWVKMPFDGDADYGLTYRYLWRIYGSSDDGMLLRLDNEYKIIRFGFYDRVPDKIWYYVTYDISTWTANTWHHIAVTWDVDVDMLNLYVDNILRDTENTWTVIPEISDTIQSIGVEHNMAAWYWKGNLDEFRISNIARTSFTLTTPSTDDTNTVALWHCDESVGTTVYDETSNNNDGTMNGATWVGPTWTTGKNGGNALEFDGVDDYVTVPANSITGNPMTITWWMNTNDMAAVVFMDKLGYTGTEGVEIWLYSNTGGYGYLNVRGSGSANVASSSDYHGEWVHVAVVFEGTTASIYRNGVFDTGGTIGEVSTSSQDFIMGMYKGLAGWHFDGVIDEVQIWGMALTPCQIQLAMQGKIEILPDAGVIIYKSAFHNIEEGDTLTIGIVPSDPSITIDHLELHHTTPKKKSSPPTVTIDAQCDNAIFITITNIPDDTMTAHYWIILNNGEHVGLNLHFNH